SVTPTSDVYDAFHIVRNGVNEYPIVILCSREEVVVKGIRAQYGERFLFKPCRAKSAHPRKKISNQSIRILKFTCFVNGLDVAPFCNRQRIAEISCWEGEEQKPIQGRG